MSDKITLSPYVHKVDSSEPQEFSEFVGQNDVKQLIIMSMYAAYKRKTPLPHFIFSGDAGHGKTTIAKILLRTFGVPFCMTDGSTMNKLERVSGYVFIDEIHNLAAETCDRLNILMDNGIVHFIGATTQFGNLPKPFRSRFRNIEFLEYELRDIKEILKNFLARAGTAASGAALDMLAERSRNVPRTAIQYARAAIETMIYEDATSLDVGVVERFFTYAGIDENGLMPRDRRYLAALPEDGQKVGLQYLSAVLSVDQKTILEDIEPYLMQRGLCSRGPQGRFKYIEPTKRSISALGELFRV